MKKVLQVWAAPAMSTNMRRQLDDMWQAANKHGARQPEIYIVKGIWLHTDHPGCTSDDQGSSYRPLTDGERDAIKPWADAGMKL